MVAADGGAAADVAHAHVARAAGFGEDGIHAVLGQTDGRIRFQIGGGEAQGVAQVPPGRHGAGKQMPVAVEAGGPLHVAGGNQLAQIGGGDDRALKRTLGHHVIPKAVVAAPGSKQRRVSGAAIAEAVIIAAHQVRSVIVPHQQRKVFIPGHVHKRLGKGQDLNLLDAVQRADQQDAVCNRGQQQPVLAGAAVKGHDRRGQAERRGSLGGFGKQRSVAQMNAVKKAQGDHACHGNTSMM